MLTADDESSPADSIPAALALEQVLTARRSIYFYRQTAVPVAHLRWALEVAILGPNHHRTRPWRFHVFTGAGREQLVQAFMAAAVRLRRDPTEARGRALEAPVMIVVSCVPDLTNPKVKREEEEFATAAAIENLMLALTAVGVGSIWITGALATSPEVADALSLPQAQGRIMGIVEAGYADLDRRLAPRPPIDHTRFTTWIDS